MNLRHGIVASYSKASQKKCFESLQDNTYFIILWTCQQREMANCHWVHLGIIDIQLSTMVTCLAVVIDSELTFMAHIKLLPERCTICCALSVEATWPLVHTLVISHVEYCNSIFGFMSAVHLQFILNTAACLSKFNHITNSMRDKLHWQPVQ